MSRCELTTLNHELLDDAMESGALIAETLLAGSQSTVVVLDSDAISVGGRLSYRKFSAVLGTVLPYRPITIRPSLSSPWVISKYTYIN